MTASASEAMDKTAVLVTGRSEAALRRFLAGYVRPALGLQKHQWRISYREHYGLAVLSRPLRLGQDAAAFYASAGQSVVLVLACLAGDLPDSGREAARAWLKARGFGNVAELAIAPGASENERIDQGAEVVNFINLSCPWRA